MIVVTGGTGKLGGALQSVYPEAQFPDRKKLNITDKKSVEEYIKNTKPTLLIHTAAYTSVAGAEKEKENCWNINVGGTENIVDALKKYSPGCVFVYISTACVFYGDRGMYREDDIPSPKNFYALTKLIGEYVAKRSPQYLITRTNFVAREKWPYAKAFTDRYGTYLFADDVARALKENIDGKKQGLIHIVGDKKLSMFDLAKITTPDVQPMTMEEVSMPLTVDMTLDTARISPYTISK